MRARTYPRERMGNDAVLIHDVRNPTGKTRLPCPISFSQHMVRIAQEPEGETMTVGKGFIVGDSIETRPQNVRVTLSKSVMEVTEPVPFRSSATSVGFGIKPQHHFLTQQVGQTHHGAIVCRHSKIRGLGTNSQHVWSPQQPTDSMGYQGQERHYPVSCRPAYTRSMMVAIPMPPPIHRVTRPVVKSRCSSSSSTVPSSIAPVAPMG